MSCIQVRELYPSIKSLSFFGLQSCQPLAPAHPVQSQIWYRMCAKIREDDVSTVKKIQEAFLVLSLDLDCYPA